MNTDIIIIICLYVATFLCVIISIHFDKRTKMSFHDILFIEYAQSIEDDNDDDEDAHSTSSESPTELLSDDGEDFDDEKTKMDHHLTDEIKKYNEALAPNKGYILVNENKKYEDEMLYKSWRREWILNDIKSLNSGL
jgi:hypothetical protein